MQELAPLLALGILPTVAYWALRMLVVNWRLARTARLQLEAQKDIIQRLGDAPSLMAYLESDAAQRLLSVPDDPRPQPFQRVLSSLQGGILLLSGGLACHLLEGQVAEAAEGFRVLGTLGIALGLGFLVAGAVSYGLSRAWGLTAGVGPSAGHPRARPEPGA